MQARYRVAGKRVQEGKHSRWTRNLQRLGGTHQMWTILSFTGRFDVAYLEECIAKGGRGQPVKVPGERTDKQKRAVRDAQLARAKLRRGAFLERLQDKLWRSNRELNPEQQQVLRLYQTGELKKKANELTMTSGHGRLRKDDESFVGIGGSTGGFVRVVLDDWEPPDLSEFQA